MALTRRPRRSRRRVWWAAIIVALALATAAGILVVPRLLDSPERARARFATALAKGEAGALRSVVVADDRALLTDAALRDLARRGGLPTDVVVAGEQVDYVVAGTTHGLPLPVEQVDGRWRVRPDFATLNLSGTTVTMAVDGVAITDRAAVLVLPGVHRLTSADPLLTFEPIDVVVAAPGAPTWTDPTPVLTPAGLDAVRAAAGASLRRCLAEAAQAHPGCPTFTDPPGMLLTRETLTASLVGDDPTTSLLVDLDKGAAWGTSSPITARVKVTADALRRTDATATRYEQETTLALKARVAIVAGAVDVVWTA